MMLSMSLSSLVLCVFVFRSNSRGTQDGLKEYKESSTCEMYVTPGDKKTEEGKKNLHGMG